MNSLATPPVDPYEQKDPDYIDKMPVPCSCFEADMLLRREVTFASPI